MVIGLEASMVDPKGRQYYPGWHEHCPAGLANNDRLIFFCQSQKKKYFWGVGGSSFSVEGGDYSVG